MAAISSPFMWRETPVTVASGVADFSNEVDVYDPEYLRGVENVDLHSIPFTHSPRGGTYSYSAGGISCSLVW